MRSPADKLGNEHDGAAAPGVEHRGLKYRSTELGGGHSERVSKRGAGDRRQFSKGGPRSGRVMAGNPFTRRRLVPWLGMAPALLLFGVFMLLPALAVAPLSLTNISGVVNAPWKIIGFANYREFFSGGQLSYNISAIERTLIYCVVCTSVQNVFALGLAVLLNRRMRGLTFYRAVVFLPVILGVTICGLVWSLFLNASWGPVCHC